MKKEELKQFLLLIKTEEWLITSERDQFLFPFISKGGSYDVFIKPMNVISFETRDPFIETVFYNDKMPARLIWREDRDINKLYSRIWKNNQ